MGICNGMETPDSNGGGRLLGALTAAGVAIIVAVALFVHVNKSIAWGVLGACVLVVIALGIRYGGGRRSG
jgi:hypothetical protein